MAAPNMLDRIAAEIRAAPAFEQAAERVCETLHREVPRYNWVGVYAVEGDTLVLRAWKGPAPTEHASISVGQGICGLAAREDRTVVVDDVAKDPRYLACFLWTRSEIVVPIRKGGRVVGEIDVDGDRLAAFDRADEALLGWVADRLGERSA